MKTNYILFQTPKSRLTKSVRNFQLKLRNNAIDRVSSTRFLGVLIDENLSWKIHIDIMKQKMRAALDAVMRIRVYSSSEAMLCLYHLLLLSHVCYCTTNWCFGNETRIHQLQSICNKFIRLVFGLKKRDSVKNVMKQNGLLTIEQVYHVELAIFMYKTVKKTSPSRNTKLISIKIKSCIN